MDVAPTAIETTVVRYLGGYPLSMRDDVAKLIAANKLAPYLARKYPARHAIQSDAALYDYTLELKQTYLRSSPPLHKVIWQNKMDVMQKVLGLHTAVSRVQGARLKAKAEIRVASLFKSTAPEFLEMVVVHELAHLREFDHNKAFYQLCRHMLPDYDQIEFDLRLLLLQRELESAEASESS